MIKSLIKICFQPNKDNKYAIGLGRLNLVQLLNNCVLHRTSRQNCRLHSYHAIHIQNVQGNVPVSLFLSPKTYNMSVTHLA